MVISDVQINSVFRKILEYSSVYNKKYSISGIETIFRSEKVKWHCGLPFHSVINNVIMEYVFSYGTDVNMESILNKIYNNDVWKEKAFNSICLLKNAQQVDSVDRGSNAIFAPATPQKMI